MLWWKRSLRMSGRTNKTVLVTGGAGFVGSHLCRELLSRGESVVCIDNFFTGSRENIQEFVSHPQFTLIKHDVIEPFVTEADQVYNLACPASPVHYQFNAIRTVKANVLGTMNMLGLCKRTGATMLQASTSEVYGDPQVHPQSEEYWGHVNPLGPRACYDEGKRIAETLCMDYHRQNSVNIKIVRIFNTYGPNMAADDGRVISNFITQALRGTPITLFGTGEQTRSFCFVTDLVSGLVKMMNETSNEQKGPINIGNPEETTMRALAELVLDLTRSKSKLDFLPLPKDDPKRRRPNITRAREVLGWEPTVSLKEGLKRTIDYFDNILSNPQEETSPFIASQQQA